jgi:hypothetical protein
MADIIFFDYWTRGIRHFKKISVELAQQNITTLLLHTASWRGDLDIENIKINKYEECIEGIVCRDIMYYENSIVNALKKEKPKAVILLNVQTEDRIIIRYCRSNNIKTIYLMHGTLINDTKLSSITMDSAFGIKDRLIRFKKYRILIKEYFRAFNQKNIFGFLSLEYFSYFIKLFLSPGRVIYNIWKFKDSYPDIALVYTQSDFDLFITKMGYPAHKVRVVGNYNLDEVFEKVNTSGTYDLIKSNFNLPNDAKYILYIEGGFFTTTYSIPGWTLENIANEIRNICNTISQFNLFLIVKLHPSSNYLNLEQRINDIKNLKITRDFDITYLNMNALAVFGQSSSVLRIPLLIKKPLFILSLEPLNLIFHEYIDNNFGELIDSYSKLEYQVKKLLSGEVLVNSNTNDNIKYNLLPFDGLATKRICNEIMMSIK